MRSVLITGADRGLVWINRGILKGWLAGLCWTIYARMA